MRKLLILLVVILVILPAFAQDDATTVTNHFAFEASAMGFTGAGTSAATLLGGSVNLTRRFDIGYEQVIVPDIHATYYMGTVGYTIPLSAMLSKKLENQMVFNYNKWALRPFAGVGVLRQDLTGVMEQHIATALGIGLHYVADRHVGITVAQFQWLHSPVLGPGRDVFVTYPNVASIAAGLQLAF